MTAATIPGQIDVDEAIAQALGARDEALVDVAAAASDEAKTTANRIVDEAAAAGVPFSANDLRHKFELAQIRGPMRGWALRHALRDRHVIEVVNETVSSDRGTHGKRIFLYRGTPQESAP